MPLAILSLLGYCLLLARLTQRDAGVYPPVVVAAITMVSYAAALMGVLPWVARVMLLGGVALLAWLLIDHARSCPKGSVASIARPRLPLSRSLGVFAGLAALATAICAPAAYWDWDEFSHWGLAAKTLILRHALWDSQSAVAFTDYPPGTALFQYWALSGARFTEGGTMAAQAVFMLAFLIPVLRAPDSWVERMPCTRQTLWAMALRGAAILLAAFSILNLFGFGWCRLDVDGMLAVVFGSTLAAYAASAPGSRWAVGCALAGVSILPLLKASGLLFALVGAATIAVDACVGQVAVCRDRRLLALLVLLMLVPVAVHVTWAAHVEAQADRTCAAVAISGQAPDSLLPVQRPGVVKEFGRALVFRRVGNLDLLHIRSAAARTPASTRPHLPRWLILSPLVWSALLAGLAIATVCRYDHPARHRVRRLHIMLAVGLAVYLLGLLLAYLCRFPAHDAIGLASFSRYVGTYVAAWAVFASSLWLSGPEPAIRPWRIGVAAALLGGLVWTAARSSVTPLVPPLLSPNRQAIRDIAATVATLTPENSRIYHIAQGSDGFDHMVIRYELAPRRTQSWGWSLGPASPDGSLRQVDLSPQEWAAGLAAFDYVLVTRTNPVFLERFGPLFDSLDGIGAHRLFRVAHDSTGVLRLIAAD